jgi:hypothetical protein
MPTDIDAIISRLKREEMAITAVQQLPEVANYQYTTIYYLYSWRCGGGGGPRT